MSIKIQQNFIYIQYFIFNGAQYPFTKTCGYLQVGMLSLYVSHMNTSMLFDNLHKLR